jgi:hypothetical protein
VLVEGAAVMLEIVPVMQEVLKALGLLGDFLKTHSGMAVTGFLSSLVAITTLFILGSHRRAQRYSWDSQRLLYLHSFLSSAEQMEARRSLRSKTDVATWQTKDDDFADVISAAYDQAGILLLAPGLVTSKQTKYLLKSSWGKSICEQFEHIEKRENYRDLTKSLPLKTHTLKNHFVHFGDLYRLAKKAREPSSLTRITTSVRAFLGWFAKIFQKRAPS